MLRDKPESRNVQINFSENFMKKILRKLRVNVHQSNRDE